MRLGGQPSKAITCRTGLGGRQIDVVLSDMAPSNPGMASVNHDMTLQLVYSVLEVIPSQVLINRDEKSLPISLYEIFYFSRIKQFPIVLSSHSSPRLRPLGEDFCRIQSQQSDCGPGQVETNSIVLKIFSNLFYRFYSTVKRVKPESSRRDSAELFLLAQNLRPRKL